MALMTTAYITDPIFASREAHHLRDHVESADRMIAIQRKLDGAGVSDRMLRLNPEPISDELILTVHDRDYLDDVLKWSETQEGVMIGADTYCLPESFKAARLSAGAVLRGVQAVMSGEASNALVCSRPPGHHAIPQIAMGFCLLANVAIAAKYARVHLGAKRILIVDYDVHHGNGTQDIFYHDPDTLFISLHRYGHFYPGTGALNEIGNGTGRGATINIPLQIGVGDLGYAAAFESVIWPAARRFKPDLIIVSAGFDAHWSDRLVSGIQLTLNGYARMTRDLISMADELCNGKIVVALEGGYHLDALSYGVLNAAYALLGDSTVVDPLGASRNTEPDISTLIERIRALHGLE